MAALPGAFASPWTLGAAAAVADGGPVSDWTSFGLILGIVGCFLLANGLLFRHPQAMVEMRFSRGALKLRTLRTLIFHRVQLALGFVFLLTGFAAQLFGRAQPPPDPAESSLALWVGAAVLMAIVLEVLGWWWSLSSFRRHVRSWLREHPPDLETDTALAQELGELFGLRAHADDTVQGYVARVRAAVGLAPPPPRRQQSSQREPETLLAADDFELG